MAINADAEPNPSSTTISGPRQQADASPPAKTAPNNESLPPVVEGVSFILVFQGL